MTDDETAFPSIHIDMPGGGNLVVAFWTDPARIAIRAWNTSMGIECGLTVTPSLAAELAAALLAAAKAGGWVEPALSVAGWVQGGADGP